MVRATLLAWQNARRNGAGPSLLMARRDWFIVPEDQFEGVMPT
nr:hypothetical protein [[Micrococcus luteus] ATCC 49442]